MVPDITPGMAVPSPLLQSGGVTDKYANHKPEVTGSQGGGGADLQRLRIPVVLGDAQLVPPVGGATPSTPESGKPREETNSLA